MIQIKNNKAFIGTLLALLLGFFLLNLRIDQQYLVSENQTGLKETLSLENLNAKYENISDNIFNLLEKTGGVNWTITGNKVSFTETLPDKKRKTQYSLDLDTYSKFVNEHKGNLDVNLEASSLSLGLFILNRTM